MKRHTPGAAPRPNDRLSSSFTWLLLATISASTLLLVTESYDSTVLKTPAVIAGAGLLVMLLAIRWKDRPDLALTPVHLGLLLLLLAGGASLAASIHVRGGLLGLLSLGSLYILFAASASAWKEQLHEERLHLGLAGLAAVTGIVALAQTVLAAPSQLFLTSGNQVIMSTLGNSSYYAGYLVLTIPLLLGIGLANRKKPSLARSCALLVLVMLYLIIRTESRSSWIALVAALPIFFLLTMRSARTGWIAALAVLAGLGLFALLSPEIVQRRIAGLLDPSGTSSFERRLSFYEGAWRAFLSSPVIGNGIGNFLYFLPKFRSPDYWVSKSEDIVPHAHNEFLELMSETGLLGLLAFCGAAVVFAVYARRTFRTLEGRDRTILAGYVSSLLAVLIDNMGSMNLRTMPVAAGFWIVAGAAMRYLPAPTFAVPFRISWGAPIARYAVVGLLLAAAPFYAAHVAARYHAGKVFMEALMFRFRGDAPNAARKFDETLRSFPLHQEAGLYLAAELVDQEEYRRAEELTAALLGEYPYAPKAHLLRGIALFELGRTGEARAEIDREIAIASYPQAYYFASIVAGKAGDAAAERNFLVGLVEACVRGVRTDYLEDGIGRLASACGQGRESECRALIGRTAAVFALDRPIVRASMLAYLALGGRAEAERLAASSVATGLMTREECDALLSATP